MAGTPPLPLLATADDLGTWLGEAIPADQKSRAEYLLRVASARVRRHTGQPWVSDDSTTVQAPDEVVGVAVQAAARVFLNVEGYTGETDNDYSYQRGGSWAEAGTITFTPGEEATLDAYTVGRRRSGLYTIPTTRTRTDEMLAAEYDPFGEGWPSS